MKKKRYILLSRVKSKYDECFRYYYKLFDNYFDLQRHLSKFWYIEKNNYTIFVETDIKKDYSLNDTKKDVFYE